MFTARRCVLAANTQLARRHVWLEEARGHSARPDRSSLHTSQGCVHREHAQLVRRARVAHAVHRRPTRAVRQIRPEDALGRRAPHERQRRLQSVGEQHLQALRFDQLLLLKGSWYTGRFGTRRFSCVYSTVSQLLVCIVRVVFFSICWYALRSSFVYVTQQSDKIEKVLGWRDETNRLLGGGLFARAERGRSEYQERPRECATLGRRYQQRGEQHCKGRRREPAN